MVASQKLNLVYRDTCSDGEGYFSVFLGGMSVEIEQGENTHDDTTLSDDNQVRWTGLCSHCFIG